MATKRERHYKVKVRLSNQRTVMLDIDVVGAQRLVTMSAVDETDFTYLQEALLVAVMEGVPPHWRVKFLSMWAIIAHQLDVKEGLLSEDNEPPF